MFNYAELLNAPKEPVAAAPAPATTAQQ
jgi:hypothetical protein